MKIRNPVFECNSLDKKNVCKTFDLETYSTDERMRQNGIKWPQIRLYILFQKFILYLKHDHIQRQTFTAFEENNTGIFHFYRQQCQYNV